MYVNVIILCCDDNMILSKQVPDYIKIICWHSVNWYYSPSICLRLLLITMVSGDQKLFTQNMRARGTGQHIWNMSSDGNILCGNLQTRSLSTLRRSHM